MARLDQGNVSRIATIERYVAQAVKKSSYYVHDHHISPIAAFWGRRPSGIDFPLIAIKYGAKYPLPDNAFGDMDLVGGFNSFGMS